MAQDSFLYVLGYPSPGWQTLYPLARAEAVSLTGGRITDKRFALSEYRVDIEESAYIACGVDVFCESDSYEATLQAIEERSFSFAGFRVEVIKPNECPLPTPRITRDVADRTDGHPNLKHPSTRLVLAISEDHCWFGRVFSTRQADWKRIRPFGHGYCQGLSVQMARAIVNLVGRRADSFLDPCCGSGTIVGEAALRGLRVEGGDMNWKMAKATRAYLAANGMEGTVSCADARLLEGSWDVIATNLPYGIMGKALDCSDPVEIAHNLVPRAERLAFVASSPIPDISPRELIALPTSKKLTRYIHVVGPAPSPVIPA